MVHVLKDKLLWFAGAAAVMFALYLAVDHIGRRLKRQAAATPEGL